MRLRILLFVLAFFIWLLLTWSLDPQHIAAGFIIGLLVSFLTADIFDKPPQVFKNLKRYVWFLYYVMVFIWECIKANIDGAYRTVHPDLPINPGIVKVKTTLKSDAGLTFLANSLSLKPGTMTVDVDKEKGFLYIHWADVKTQDIDKATELITGKFERILKRIFA
ncbi:MAG: Na+/H+ antiporter subunit E [Candidatus Omnitrophica bacterium]|nr:Na+/H+ antiporter subunit E [Candidatus Omnitrophota bacterium]